MNDKKLTIELSTAKKLYKDSPEWFQRKLEETFGKENLILSIMDKVKYYADAVALADASTLRECIIYPSDTIDVVAYKKLKLIVKVLNEGWTPDWDDANQYKYYPSFVMTNDFNFSISNCNVRSVATSISSSLCFHSSELATYAGMQFAQLYEDFLTSK